MRATPNRAARFLFSEKDDTKVVARNSMCYNCLAVFRVTVLSTLKIVNCLIFSYLCSMQAVSFQKSLTCGGDFFDDFLAAGLWYFDVCAGIDQVCLGGEAVAHY